MLINLSNHPSELWEVKQKKQATKLYGEIEDFTFPDVDPTATEDEVWDLAYDYIDMCLDFLSDYEGENNAVHVMGEFNFCFTVISGLLNFDIACVASTSRRISEKVSPNEKRAKFKFVRFREYEFG